MKMIVSWYIRCSGGEYHRIVRELSYRNLCCISYRVSGIERKILYSVSFFYAAQYFTNNIQHHKKSPSSFVFISSTSIIILIRSKSYVHRAVSTQEDPLRAFRQVRLGVVRTALGWWRTLPLIYVAVSLKAFASLGL